MQKYSIFNLVKNAFSNHENWDLAWKDPTPKEEYDVVIIVCYPNRYDYQLMQTINYERM